MRLIQIHNEIFVKTYAIYSKTLDMTKSDGTFVIRTMYNPSVLTVEDDLMDCLTPMGIS